MKAWNRYILTEVAILIIIGSCALAGRLHAQALDQPDSIVQVTAEAEGLSPVDPSTLPLFAGCWWTVYPGTGPVPMPCPPLDLSVPIYEITPGIYLVDSTGGAVSLNTSQQSVTTAAVTAAVERQGNAIADLIEQVQETEFEQTMAMSFGMEVPTPGDGGGDGGGTNLYGASFSIPDYGTNLWIAQVALTNGALTAIASNTLPLVMYEVQTNASLLTTNWGTFAVFPFFYGSETTNWTPLGELPTGSTQAQLFFRLKSWADDGSGLPIWWQLQYFGTNGIDPYGNPAGDGWSNLQKFQNGWNPSQFYTPAAPQGLTAILHQTNNTATVSWLPSAGLVTNYLITKRDYWTGQTTDFNVSPNDEVFFDNLSGSLPVNPNDFGPAARLRYSATAQYAGGNSAASSVDLGLPDTAIGVKAVSDGQGKINLIVTGLPDDITGIKVFRAYYDNWGFGVGVLGNDIWQTSLNYTTNFSYVLDSLTNGYFEVSAASITNGVFAVPDSQASFFGGYHYWVQGERANGTTTEWSADYAPDWTIYREPFLDARQLLKDNLRFVLRAASKTDGFRFGLHSPYGYYSDVAYWPTNYAYASYYGAYNYEANGRSYLDIARPLVDDYEFQNFVYDPNHLGDEGYLTTGIEPDGYITDNPTTWFDINTLLDTASPTVPDSLLSSSLSQWICPVNIESGDYPTSANQHNVYGLPYLSVNAVSFINNTVYSTVYSPVTTVTNGFPYYETAQPVFQTVAYNFWIPNRGYYDENSDWHYLDLLPEQDGFSPTNASNDHIIVPVGGSVQVAGYAKLALQNGYSGVYGYLGQYFDKAYKVDTNGVTTTNTTGVLSAYGNFFATEAGRAALVTMSDIDTGERGTNIVYCVSLQVDKNHDGVMDSAFNSADVTSQASPMVCWINNGYTVAGTGSSLDKELPLPLGQPEYANYRKGKVTCQRDLENFFRLWIRGVPQLSASEGYAITFSMTALNGTPAINLYMSSDSLGGTGYLTDTNVAADQARTILSPNPAFGVALGTVSSQQSYTLPANFFDYNYPYYSRFLFEGAGIGEGQLTLSISQNSNVLCQTSVYLDLHDVKDLYEQARITNVATTYPAMVNTTNASSFVLDHPLPMNPTETNQLIVYVHGWRMTQFDYYSFSESVLKRLYWAGYQGQFASLKWPTLSADNSGNISQYLTYNRSEHIAFDSGIGASAYFDSLKARFPDYSINVVAHSMGNIVMMETLKNQLSAGHTNIDNYVLMQAAVPAHCYDTSLANYSVFTAAETTHQTPDIYRGYSGSIDAALNGKMINFFNTNDYALATGAYLGVQVNWEKNQVDNKPDSYWTYASDGTNSYCYYDGTRVITDPHELMPFVARPRSKAAGAFGGVGGLIQGNQVDLKANFGFDRSVDEHSAQFNWSIQQLGGPNGFYRQLGISLKIFQPPTP